MGRGLPLCPQLFLDDSKMKNFITCYKGTAAPSSPPSISLPSLPTGPPETEDRASCAQEPSCLE